MSAAWYDPRIARGMAQQLTRWHQRIRAGEKALGWKAGFGTTDAMERLKLHAPLIGHLTDQSQLRSGESVDVSGWAHALAEPEIAVYIGKNVARGASREAAVAAIAGIAPAIELVDLTEPSEDVTAILAGNVYHRHVVLGTRENVRRGSSVDGLSGTVSRDGTEIATSNELQGMTGDYVDIVRHIADLLAAFGERLTAGQVVITGSVVQPFPVQPGETIAFRLQTGPEVAVRVEPAP